MPTLALCMIVKNEAALIERCLDSVRPLIDYVLIQDTGSSDGTQDTIRRWLKRHEIPGKVVEEPWRDFSHNRSLALAELRQRDTVDYALIIDADDLVITEPGFDPLLFKESLTADMYYVTLRLGPIRYHRAQIVSNRKEWYYRGIIHEFLDHAGPHTSDTATGFFIVAGVEGSRSRDPDKYRNDALLLEATLASETDLFLQRRYTFYLGQSWRDSGDNYAALDAYTRRSSLGGWSEEIFQSLYQAGLINERLCKGFDAVIGHYLRAWEICPGRAETLHAAARVCRTRRQYHTGYLIAKQGITISEPKDGLFIEPWIYRYGMLDEFAIHAYWTGHYVESLAACEKLLSDGQIPDTARVTQNAQFARDRLA